jgi:predicted glutamine amidotransferase
MVSVVNSSGIGKDLFNIIWEALRDMASDQTFNHELHEELDLKPGEYKHSDGWGCTWLISGNSLKSYHSLTPIWQDNLSGEMIEEISQSPLLIIHARKASPGFTIAEEYCHPFIRESPVLGQAAFTHNGTITDFERLHISKRYVTSIRSDTERLFYSILTALEDTNSPREELLNKLITDLPEYTGANYFLFLENELWASRNFKRYEEFLSLYYLTSRDFTVVSSERILPLGRSWVNLANHQLIKVNMQDSGLIIY